MGDGMQSAIQLPFRRAAVPYYYRGQGPGYDKVIREPNVACREFLKVARTSCPPVTSHRFYLLIISFAH